ncbi:protein of unknown function [Moritella yayanosii]|uniref:Uncharacterized protein n=1 Tax=Moritella yayanosii TaxID=69539 RepID=A0A330LR40_9GAMM|nr:protein of unknown function [Moritella yayanosii]
MESSDTDMVIVYVIKAALKSLWQTSNRTHIIVLITLVSLRRY